MNLFSLFLVLTALAQVCSASSSQLVYLRVTVTMSDPAGDQLAPSLGKEEFQVLHNGVSQPISYFSAEPSPSSVSILLDVDGSMQNLDLDAALDQLIALCRSRYVPDELSLIVFSQKTAIVRDFESKVTTFNLEEMLPQLSLRNGYGKTGIQEAFAVAEEMLRTRSSNYNRAVILITDAEEDLSRAEALKLTETLQNLGLRVYGIFFPGENRLDLGRLHHLSSITGGTYFRVSDIGILNLLVRWALHELRYHYVIGFPPVSDLFRLNDNTIDVRLTNPEKMSDPHTRFNVVRTIGRVRQSSRD